MSIFVDEDTRVVVQGLTGRSGRFQTPPMLSYGTRVVAGVSPGHAGEAVAGLPVYNSISDAVRQHGANTSIVLVPAPFAKSSVLGAIDSGIKTVVVITEGIPQIDVMYFIARAAEEGVSVIGPNCPGIINPYHKVKVGIMPGQVFQPGKVGIASRSGTLTYEIAWHISQSGLGQSTCVGIGGDPIIGLDFIEMLKRFANDDQTQAVVLIGEIGGNAEEKAAEYLRKNKYPKPVVAYVAGRTALPGRRMGHAGAIILGDSGTALSKIEALRGVGVFVAERPSEVASLLRELCEK